MKKILLLAPILLALSGCDYLDLNGEIEAQKQIKNANAIGAGCKQSGKSLEDCYQSNPKAPKAAVFDGWKTMDEYMRENNMQIQSLKEEVIVEETKNDNSKPPQNVAAEPKPPEEKPKQ